MDPPLPHPRTEVLADLSRALAELMFMPLPAGSCLCLTGSAAGFFVGFQPDFVPAGPEAAGCVCKGCLGWQITKEEEFLLYRAGQKAEFRQLCQRLACISSA